MAKAQKSRASKARYVSPNQLELVGFESPFTKHLDPGNRWVKLAKQIPWDKIANIYQRQLNNSITGAGGINPRVAIGAIFIKHMCDLSDREAVQQIQENVYMQYFIGFSSFSYEPVFDASLFVDLRKRFGAEQINAINETIMGLVTDDSKDKAPQNNDPVNDDSSQLNQADESTQPTGQEPTVDRPANKGELIVDATACPQDISYPTDLNLLNDAREQSEKLIDILYGKIKLVDEQKIKPRTYREIARKEYLKVAQKKHKTNKEIGHALRKQLSYLHRNIKYIHQLLQHFDNIPLKKREYKYLLVIQTLYEQQRFMYDNKTHSVEHRIVSIHQPHVRPIVRGKTNAYVEFGSKIQMSIMNGITFLEDLSWDAFNEGARLISTVENYKRRFGYYPQKVFADKIYCNRDNRAKLKILNITLVAKPLGRPSQAVDNHIRPGERNPIEGKFGQAKTAYGMNRIKARLRDTSESWIASIVLVLNLIKLIGLAPLSPLIKLYEKRLVLEKSIGIIWKYSSRKNGSLWVT
ncbi:MAG: IS5 family transposase [Pyrinomonadaceae bacterium]|nr:IS5 family transposase [Sphingobacteriaceae bacterium]